NDNPALLTTLREATARTLATERTKNNTLTMQWTGQPAVLADLRTSGAAAASRAEMLAIPVTLLVAWWAFGSIVNALLAVAVAALVTIFGAGAMGLLSVVFAPSAIARSIVSLVGLALTVDYMLLMTRADEQVKRSQTKGGTNDARHRRARSTAMIAAIVVAAGFVGLTIAPTGELQTTAVTGALVAILAAAGAITLGRSTPNVTSEVSSVNETSPVDDFENPSRWLRWGTVVTQHPILFVIASAIPLLFLANHARTANLSTPIDNWLPESSESTQALDLLTREQRASVAGTAHVLLKLPAGTPVLSVKGWKALKEASQVIRGLPHAGDVHSIESIGTNELLIAQQVFSQGVRDHYVSRDGQTALIDVIPISKNGTADALSLVDELRALNFDAADGMNGASLFVSGLPAYSMDYQRATREILPWVVLAATAATLVALLVAFRAPMVAIKAVALNVLVAAAALGATVFVFQDGFGITLLGRAAVGSILPTVPLLGFAATFGISMDYELFLLNGVLAERREGRSEANAIALGMSRSAGLITRAACVMIAVFSAFAVSDMLPLSMLGFALAMAVLLDATLVRLVLAPALLAVAGRWNWWPNDGAKNHRPA
ncbi:MAG: MMPL family transporter, partial [Gemmatimonadaceae bacterium]